MEKQSFNKNKVLSFNLINKEIDEDDLIGNMLDEYEPSKEHQVESDYFYEIKTQSMNEFNNPLLESNYNEIENLLEKSLYLTKKIKYYEKYL